MMEGTGKKLPKEVFKFAKSLGIDLKGLEPEAEDIWNSLNDMAKNSSIEYEQFVQSALKEGKGNDDPEGEKKKFVRPSAGFVFSLKTVGGDKVRIRDLTDSSGPGKVLYVNVCSFVGIQQPVDSNNNIISAEKLDSNGVEIPMIIGSTRDLNPNEIAVDVLIHPVVKDCCDMKPTFKKELVDLIINCVESETKVQLLHGSFIDISNRTYVGGRGDTKSIPVLFPVSDGNETKPYDDTDLTSNKQDSLLRSIVDSQASSDANNSDQSISITPFSSTTSPNPTVLPFQTSIDGKKDQSNKGPIISEVSSSCDKDTTDDNSQNLSSSLKDTQPAVNASIKKSEFLMSESHTTKKIDSSKDNSSLKSGFLEKKGKSGIFSNSSSKESSKNATSKPTFWESQQLDDILAGADDEYRPYNPHYGEDENADILAGLASMASQSDLFSYEKSTPPQPTLSSNLAEKKPLEKLLVYQNCLGSIRSVDFSINEESVLKVSICGLSVDDLSKLNLQANDSEVIVKLSEDASCPFLRLYFVDEQVGIKNIIRKLPSWKALSCNITAKAQKKKGMFYFLLPL